MNNTMYGIFNKLIIKNNLNTKINTLILYFKIANYFWIARNIFINIKKALSVVQLTHSKYATGRGLHFLRNWFKNKVPHHPASQM